MPIVTAFILCFSEIQCVINANFVYQLIKNPKYCFSIFFSPVYAFVQQMDSWLGTK